MKTGEVGFSKDPFIVVLSLPTSDGKGGAGELEGDAILMS